MNAQSQSLVTVNVYNGAKILYERSDLLSNILTLQLIRKKYKYIVPAIYKMYVRVLEYRPTTSSLAHTLAGTILVPTVFSN